MVEKKISKTLKCKTTPFQASGIQVVETSGFLDSLDLKVARLLALCTSSLCPL